MENIRIEEQVTLPSKGVIYEEEVNPQVLLSTMKTKHEMLRLSASEESQKIIAQIIDDCITNDVGISSYDMCLGDFQYLMFMLRVVTFGPEYEMISMCPYCGTTKTINVNLDEYPVKEFNDSLLELLTLTLPKTGSTLELTLQTPRSLDKITKQSEEYRKKHKNSIENPTVLYTIINSIEKIDGEEMNPIKLEEWVKDLPLADGNALMTRIDELNESMGLDLKNEVTCNLCGSKYEVPFRLDSTFYRPK